MQKISARLATVTALALTLLACACASSGSGRWSELIPDGAGPTMQLVGAVHRVDVEGGVWVIRDAQAATYQPTNLPDAFRKDGLAVEAVARRRDDVVSIGMVGTHVELLRIRQRTPEQAVVTGTVAYRERMALPPGATVQVVLLDVSRQDAPAPTIAEVTIDRGDRQVPLPFSLPYDRSLIAPTGEYAVRATIRNGDDLIFTTTSRHSVITRGNPSHVDVLLQRVASAPPSVASLRGTSWLLEDLAGSGVVDRVQATLMFATDGAVNGNASCNQFRGTSTITGETITFGPLATTRRACPEAVMRQEQQYLAALHAVRRFELTAAFLYLHPASGQPLRFTPLNGR